MEPGSISTDLRRGLAVLLHWAWLLVAVTVLAGSAAYLYSASQQPVYEATTLVSVELPASRALDYNSVLASERLTRTYAERLATQPVLESVISKTGTGLDVTALQAAVNVQPVRDTQLIRASVQVRASGLAALLANTLVAEFSAADRERQAKRFTTSQESLEAQLAQVEQQIREMTGALEETGQGPDEAVERDRLVGELAQRRQAYAALLQSYEQSRRRRPNRLRSSSGASDASARLVARVLFNTCWPWRSGCCWPVGLFSVETRRQLAGPPDNLRPYLLIWGSSLTRMVRSTASRAPPPAVLSPRSPAAEAFRTLRTNLDFAGVDHPLRSLLVASPTPADGKSSVAANLAVALAQAERRVVLVDADLRRPVQHKRFGLQGEPGLSDLFLKFRPAGGERLDLEPYLQPAGTPYLKVLAAGSLPPNPAELLGSESMLAILDRLLIEAEVLIFDSPPVLAVTDAAVLAPRLDGVLMVVKPGGTKLADCRQAVEQLRWVGANLLGAVVNDAQYGGAYAVYYRSPAAGAPGEGERWGARWKALLARWAAGWVGRGRAGRGDWSG
jgi:non-specific protein-tyrosine kinase